MVSWIWRTSNPAFIVGSLFMISLVYVSYLSAKKEPISEEEVFETRMEGFSGSVFKVIPTKSNQAGPVIIQKVDNKPVPPTELHTRKLATAKDSPMPSKENQKPDIGNQPPDNSQGAIKGSQTPNQQSPPPKVTEVQNHLPAESKATPPPKPKDDRFSARPIDSSLAMPLIKGTEYFDTSVKQRYLRCKTTISRDTNIAYGKCRNFTSMRFIDGSRLVAMASFPGSGSTWSRTALEQVTGIYTGSVYCDKGLKSKGFAGELVVSSNVLAVKTHLWSKNLFPKAGEFRDPNKYKDITAVIVLVRNPLESIASYWNFAQTQGSHVATAPPNRFGDYSKWRDFVRGRAKEFTQVLHFWLEQANIPSILVIKYEDMLTDFATQLRRMLDFLQVPYTDKDFDCVANDKLEHHHRKKVKSSDRYIPADRKLVLTNLKSVEPLLNKYNISYKDIWMDNTE